MEHLIYTKAMSRGTQPPTLKHLLHFRGIHGSIVAYMQLACK